MLKKHKDSVPICQSQSRKLSLPLAYIYSSISSPPIAPEEKGKMADDFCTGKQHKTVLRKLSV